MRRSLKIRGRRKEKEKLPSGITADYSASFFAQLDRDVLDEVNASNHSSMLGLAAQSDSSEASLTSLGKNLPPLPPKPPKRGILKGPRLSVPPASFTSDAEATSPSSSIFENGAAAVAFDVHHDSNNLLQRNTLQNEMIAYQNLPAQRGASRDELQLMYSEEETYQLRRSPHQFAGQNAYQQQQQDNKLLHVS